MIGAYIVEIPKTKAIAELMDRDIGGSVPTGPAGGSSNIGARIVRYELEPGNKDSSGGAVEPFRRKVKLAPTETLREYEYEEVNDWKGRFKPL